MTQPSSADAVHEATTLEPVAPVWHTVALLLYLAGISIMSAIFRNDGLLHRSGVPADAARTINYVMSIVQEWALVGYVVWGIRRRGVTLSAIIGGRWSTARDVVRDIGVGFAALLAIWVVSVVLSLLLHLPRTLGTLERVLPHNALDLVLWCFVSASAGICEEILCRGYLQRQFTAWMKSPWGAVALQAIVFGFAHGYQGATRMIMLVFVGLILGIVALRRQSLRPGMVAHAIQDGFSGLTYYLMLARKIRVS